MERTEVSTPATNKVASRLLALVKRRQWMQDDDWLHCVGQLCEDVKHVRLAIGIGTVKQSRKAAPNPLVHGFGQSVQVVEFANKHKILLNPKEMWWMLEQGMRTGYIHGLENSRGIPKITNGIDVWIERADGTIFKGHRDWLKWDRKPREPRETSATGTSASVAASHRVAARYLEHAKAILVKDGVDTFAEKYYAVTGQRAVLMLDTPEESVASIASALQTYMDTVVAII